MERSAVQIDRRPFVAVSLALLFAGCTPAPKSAPVSYAGIELGMPVTEAQQQALGEGTETEYDKLPSTIKPRSAYTRIPAETTWRVWSGDGKPILILGMLDGKVVYKEVIHNENGKLIGGAITLLEYQ